MAGIGFELNKILSRQGYSAMLQAYGYAGLIGSGPWLIAVMSLGMLGVLLRTVAGNDELRLFFVSISLIYGLTLILTGPLQLVLTRHVSDLEFGGKLKSVFGVFVVSVALTAFIFGILGWIIFVGFVPGPLPFRIGAAALMVFVACTWVTNVFLGALKNYTSLLAGFALGFGLSLVFAWQGGKRWGVSGAMLGFVLGQTALLLVLCRAIFSELASTDLSAGFSFLPGFKKYWDLALGGLFYNFGIWIDKFMYWWVDPGADHVGGILYASPILDRVVYFSFLTIVPGMAVFLLKLETDFASKNQQFYDMVLRKGTLKQIEIARDEMCDALREGFGLLVKVQGLITGLLVLSAERALHLLGLGAVQSGVFQISLIGVFLLVLFLSLLTILYYLDKRREALICCVLMTVVSGLVTWFTIQAGERWLGFGFLVACGTVVGIASWRVNHHLNRLDYDTFTSQPLYG